MALVKKTKGRFKDNKVHCKWSPLKVSVIKYKEKKRGGGEGELRNED